MKMRQRRKKSTVTSKQVDGEAAYDGDFEATDSSQAGSVSSMSIDSLDLTNSDLNPSIVLTPIKASRFYKNTPVDKPRTSLSFSNSEPDKKDSPKTKSTKRVKKAKKSTKIKEKETTKILDKSGFTLPNLFDFTPVSEIGRKRKRTYTKINEIFSKEDSGIAVSPPSRKAKFGMKDTSTPSIFTKSTPHLSSSRNDSCFVGLESMESGLNDISPVKVVSSTPMSDYASGSSLSQMTLDASQDMKSASQHSIFSEDEALTDFAVNKSSHNKTYGGFSATKKKRLDHRKKKFSISKVDAWVNRMKDEFQDIENFELSIEG